MQSCVYSAGIVHVHIACHIRNKIQVEFEQMYK